MAALHWAVYLGFKVLPSGLSSDFGAAVSFFPYRSSPGYNRRAKALFAKLRPQWADDPAALDASVRRLWKHFARTFGEVPSCHRMIRKGRITIANVDLIDGAMASGKPVILLFVHTGNWELSGIQLAFRYPGRIFAVVDLPTGVAGTEIAAYERSRAPAEVLPTSPMVWREVLTRLKQPGGVLWISADDLSPEDVSAPFFGRAPRVDRNLGKVARLALRTGAVVVPLYCERHAGTRFTTHILPPISFAGAQRNEPAVLLAAVQALDAVFTPPVIRLIDQWFMALHYRGFAALPKQQAIAPIAADASSREFAVTAR